MHIFHRAGDVAAFEQRHPRKLRPRDPATNYSRSKGSIDADTLTATGGTASTLLWERKKKKVKFTRFGHQAAWAASLEALRVAVETGVVPTD